MSVFRVSLVRCLVMASFIQTESSIDHPGFTTHKNYTAFMREVSNDLKLKYNCDTSKKLNIPESVTRKVRLINLTVRNLEMEVRMVSAYPEYAQVAISWMPVKSYYLIFNLTLLLEYLISNNPAFLTASHLNSLKQFRSLLHNRTLEFSNDIFNLFKTGEEIEKMKVPKSDNLRAHTEKRKEQIFRKLADYSRDFLRRRDKVSRLHKRQIDEFRKSQFILSEFFYWYRIKVNYRDLEFLSAQVHPSEFVQFYNDYYLLTRNFYRAYISCINQVSLSRADSKLF